MCASCFLNKVSDIATGAFVGLLAYYGARAWRERNEELSGERETREQLHARGYDEGYAQSEREYKLMKDRDADAKKVAE